MRLQTFSTKNAGYLSPVRLSWTPRRPLKQVVCHFHILNKTGHGTVLVDRRQKPQTDRGRPTDVTSEKVSHKHPKVKHKWHISNARSSVRRTSLTTTKPCAAPAVDSGTYRGTPSCADLVPNLVPNPAFPFIKHADAEQAALRLHKPVGLILASAYILGAACQLSGIESVPSWMPAMMGATVGALYAALNRAGMRKFWRSPTTQLNVLITGGGKGIGKAIAREFLRSGDQVFITSRTMAGVQTVVADMKTEVGPAVVVDGTDCNVSSSASVARLTAYAKSKLGRIDVWINNAGYSGSFQAFVDSSPEQLQQVVSTNMVGTLLCTRAAMQVMQKQSGGGHIFNMDGAGADGMPTPQYAAYGATKAEPSDNRGCTFTTYYAARLVCCECEASVVRWLCHTIKSGSIIDISGTPELSGIAHLMGSLKAEASSKTVGVHTLSPGMVLTNLLLEGATLENKQIFNILCEQPETVAAYLVPRVRTVVARQASSTYIKYLTIPRALGKFLTAPTKANKYFNKQGEPVYLPERERILGQKRKVTARLADRAARRSQALALAYSTSMAASYLMILADSMARSRIV